MKFSAVVSLVLILHIHWVCSDSSTAVLPQSTEKAPEIQSADTKNADIESILALNKPVQKNQNEETQPSSTEDGSDESVASNEDYSGESAESAESTLYGAGTYRVIRSVSSPHEKLPGEARTFVHNAGLSGCSCFCPSRPYASEPAYTAPPPPLPYYVQPAALYAPPPASYVPLRPSYLSPPLPAASAYARNALEGDEGEPKDSMTEEARFRSAYAAQPAYPAPPPAPAAYTTPPVPQSYPSPAPNVNCGQNLLVGCAPTIANVPCSAPAY